MLRAAAKGWQHVWGPYNAFEPPKIVFMGSANRDYFNNDIIWPRVCDIFALFNFSS